MQMPDAPIDRRPSKFWKNQHARSSQPHRSRGDYDPQPADTTAAATRPIELVEEAPARAAAGRGNDRMQEMLRAAGVASGMTGIWPEERWVEEFVKALDSVISERI